MTKKVENKAVENKVEQVVEQKARTNADLDKAAELKKEADELKDTDKKKWAMKMQAHYFYQKRGQHQLGAEDLKKLLQDNNLLDKLSEEAKLLLGDFTGEKRSAGGGKDIFDAYLPTGHGKAPVYLFMYMLENGDRISPITTKEAVMSALMEGTMKQRMNLKQLTDKATEKGYKVVDGFVVAE